MEKRKIRVACTVPDDATFNEVQEAFLLTEFSFERFASDTDLIRALRRRTFDLVLVDTGGGTASIEANILSWLNCHTGKATPVVLMSATHSAQQVATALDAGADEFISRPFAPVEFRARINAALRRCDRHHVQRTVSLMGFTLDQDASKFFDRGIPIELTPREFTMAWLLFSSPGIYLSRETISTAIWGVDCEIAGRTIEQHVYKLRKKLNLSEERGVVIRTAYTQGYRLELTQPDQTDMPVSSIAKRAQPGRVLVAYA